jgi:hypothetical protein
MGTNTTRKGVIVEDKITTRVPARRERAAYAEIDKAHSPWEFDAVDPATIAMAVCGVFDEALRADRVPDL